MITFIKTKTCQIVLVVLYRALKALVKKESRIKREFDALEEGFTISLLLSPKGEGMSLKKVDGKLKKVKMLESADIEIRFKSIDAAFLTFTGMIGISRAYSEHRFALKGDITKAMGIVRMIDLAESYLFPRIITKRILRSVPKKERSTISVYRMVLLGF